MKHTEKICFRRLFYSFGNPTLFQRRVQIFYLDVQGSLKRGDTGFPEREETKIFISGTIEFKEPASAPKNEFKDERIEALYKAISNLDKIERAIMLLHLDEVPNEEIAEIVGITQNYVRVKMTRIRKILQKSYSKTIKTD